MEQVVVEGHRSEFREEDRIGSYLQARWTAHRRFAGTRIYVRPADMVDLEQWLQVKVPRDGDGEVITMTELELGLPHRLQLDLSLGASKRGKAVRIKSGGYG